MSNVTIQGALAKPDGSPQSNATIRIVALENTGEVSTTSSVDIECNSAGQYDFNLNFGYFKILARFEQRWETLGNIILGSSTPTPIDLGTLFAIFAQPARPDGEAPMDGGLYGRQNASWQPIPEQSEMAVPFNGTTSSATVVHNKHRRPRILFINNDGMEIEIGRSYPSDDIVTVSATIPLNGTLYIT